MKGSIPARAGESRCAAVHVLRLSREGSIPARAGEPVRESSGNGFALVGLSPRVRGNRAGDLWARSLTCMRVYPRACGGTLMPLGRQLSKLGLTPLRAGEPGCQLERRSRSLGLTARAMRRYHSLGFGNAR